MLSPDALALGRVALALVFVVAGLAKLADRTGLARTLVAFGLSPALSPGAALLLPVAELLCAIGLFFSPTARIAAVAAAALLTLFTAAMLVNLRKGRRPDCRCFGQVKAAPIGWDSVSRNVVLAVAAGLVASAGPGEFVAGGTLARWTASFQASSSGVKMAVVYVAVIGAVVGYQLLRPARPARKQRETPRKGAPDPPPEPEVRRVLTTTAAAEEELRVAGGGATTLAAATAGDRPLLVLFVTPGCGACERLLPHVMGLLKAQEALGLVAVSTGKFEAAKEKADGFGLPGMLVPRDAAVPEAFEVTSYPSALLMREGRAESPVAEGGEAVLRLIRKARTPALEVGDPVPSLVLRSLAGGTVDLGVATGTRRVLLFWSPFCATCQEMLPALKTWEASHAPDAPELVLVTSGSPNVNREQGLASTMLHDPRLEIGDRFGIDGTPQAVLIDERGMVASPVAAGAEAVLALASNRPIDGGMTARTP